MLEKYLKEATYSYTIHSTFKKDGIEHIVATEGTPMGGGHDDFFILYQKGDQIFNTQGTLCANIVNDEIEIVEP